MDSYENLKSAMQKLGAFLEAKQVKLVLTPSTDAQIQKPFDVTLRTGDGRMKSPQCFLNVNYNPSSVWSGDNTLLTHDLWGSVEKIFSLVTRLLEKNGLSDKASRVIRRSIRNRAVYCHSLTIASYSTEFSSKQVVLRLLNLWYFMYEIRLQKNGEDRFTSLVAELGLSRGATEEYESSISLNLHGPYSKGKGPKFSYLCAYMKDDEREQIDPFSRNRIPATLRKRLRFDLTINAQYFKTHWGFEKRKEPITFANLYRYAEKNGGWKSVVQDTLNWMLERTALSYMLTCENPFTVLEHSVWKEWQAFFRESHQGGRTPSWGLRDNLEKHGFNWRISPSAHAIIMQGRLDAQTHTEERLAAHWVATKPPKISRSKVMLAKLDRDLAREIAAMNFDFSSADMERLQKSSER